MTPEELRALYETPGRLPSEAAVYLTVHEALLRALEEGTVRAASPDEHGVWTVHTWVKNAILTGFRRGVLRTYDGQGFPFIDKTSYPPRAFSVDDGVRLVPGGSAVRRGAHLARSVVIMPPAYVNVGAYVAEGTMIDSHALVGSCAQIGSDVHLSAGAQIGGVLEPAGARPVIIEDGAFIGALAGVFEGVRVRKRVVLAAGVILTASSRIHDLVHQTEHRHEVPEGAVVIPGARTLDGAYAREHGLSAAAPIIVKYRDQKTDAATALEEALR